MLKIRTEQLTVFNKQVEQRYQHDVKRYLQGHLPRQADALGEPGLEQLIENGMEKAYGYGIDSKRDMADFLAILLEYGYDFEARAAYDWAATILQDAEMAGGTKLLQLMTRLEKDKK